MGGLCGAPGTEWGRQGSLRHRSALRTLHARRFPDSASDTERGSTGRGDLVASPGLPEAASQSGEVDVPQCPRWKRSTDVGRGRGTGHSATE